ncbi:GIY-YIG nuclease family protein [Streptomyces sp. NPDC059916]|uniref:GIY-YIG nuclease family protein n=1 Tax=Streptomyces sp. NPDC059916 TaxID=3347001 RepID=UPI00368A1E61
MDYEQPAAVYRLFDDEDHLLYVGLTHAPQQRWKDHRKEMLWWREVEFKAITWFATRREAWQAEQAAIEAERPLYNANFEGLGPMPGVPAQPWGHRTAYQYRETRTGYRIQWYLWRLAVQDAWATERERAASQGG